MVGGVGGVVVDEEGEAVEGETALTTLAMTEVLFSRTMPTTTHTIHIINVIIIFSYFIFVGLIVPFTYPAVAEKTFTSGLLQLIHGFKEKDVSSDRLLNSSVKDLHFEH